MPGFRHPAPWSSLMCGLPVFTTAWEASIQSRRMHQRVQGYGRRCGCRRVDLGLLGDTAVNRTGESVR